MFRHGTHQNLKLNNMRHARLGWQKTKSDATPLFLPFCEPLLLPFSWLPLVVWLLQVLEPSPGPLVSVLLLFLVFPLLLLSLYELLPQPVIKNI